MFFYGLRKSFSQSKKYGGADDLRMKESASKNF